MVLPTFILEKRSLLEMYADFMSHPDLFVAITDGQGPEERMVCFVEYYLTSFHEGRKGAIAKKPYNPIIGESFHCSWRVPRSGEPAKDAPSLPSPPQGSPTTEGEDSSYQLRFVAEQVSHHPPVSGFYAECPERRMCVNTHVWTKSKFMGMSIGVSMIGEGKAGQRRGINYCTGFEMERLCKGLGLLPSDQCQRESGHFFHTRLKVICNMHLMRTGYKV